MEISVEFSGLKQIRVSSGYGSSSAFRKCRSLGLYQSSHLLGYSQMSQYKRYFLLSNKRQTLSALSKADYSSDVEISQLKNARVVYSAVPSVGHNMESHPECSSRLSAILDALQKFELNALCRKDVLEIKNFKPASMDDITSVHHNAYVSGLQKALEKATEDGLVMLDLSGPTYATVTVAASKISSDPPAGFALIRPPGHHALPGEPLGFCIFGNIAIAARYVQRVHGLNRVFIIDFDVHHGNGTNDVFYEDPDIFFLSMHQQHSYPGTGKMAEIGKGAGEGTTLNLPLPGGAGDKAVLTIFDKVIVPAAQRFKPNIILVSAGYDAHVFEQFPAQFTTNTYYKLALLIKKLARELCGGLCVFFLEGGYNLKSLSHSVADTFRAFLGEPSIANEIDNPAYLYDEPLDLVDKAIAEIKGIHGL
eukprot:TRINITY_DN6002_c0_g1_i1.p1 TRINITY_DN6002_c0_g1~~TRINITY_DN6002_c0_g1_i1.p1  ORF type:complete len:421 (+),score=86.16 TRINITY_DN6002_c0_g1_i1:201-1463(+)